MVDHLLRLGRASSALFFGLICFWMGRKMGKGSCPMKPVPPWFDCLRGGDDDGVIRLRGWIDYTTLRRR